MMNSFMWGGGFEIMFSLVFLIIIGIMITVVVKGISQWNENNNSPRLTVEARVASKRTNVSHTQQFNGGDITGAQGMHTTSSTTYYVTFEVASGDRMELHVNGSEYGMLAEGDYGNLSFQGTRYLGFERVR